MFTIAVHCLVWENIWFACAFQFGVTMWNFYIRCCFLQTIRHSKGSVVGMCSLNVTRALSITSIHSDHVNISFWRLKAGWCICPQIITTAELKLCSYYVKPLSSHVLGAWVIWRVQMPQGLRQSWFWYHNVLDYNRSSCMGELPVTVQESIIQSTRTHIQWSVLYSVRAWTAKCCSILL